MNYTMLRKGRDEITFTFKSLCKQWKAEQEGGKGSYKATCNVLDERL